MIEDMNPWAIINAAGYVNIDEAEDNREQCFKANSLGPSILAEYCKKHAIKLLTYSSGLVFDGNKQLPYVESDKTNPINVYGESKAEAEKNILAINENTLVIRTCNFFSAWDDSSFISKTIDDLKEQREVYAANDVFVSPTYVPDLINISLDLMLDNEKGIYHVANMARITWADLAYKIADMAGLDSSYIKPVPANTLSLKAKRPKNNVLQSEKGIVMPSLEVALQRYLEATGNYYLARTVAV
jgi:dTDP-4-dehydrorhamnose reductase